MNSQFLNIMAFIFIFKVIILLYYLRSLDLVFERKIPIKRSRIVLSNQTIVRDLSVYVRSHFVVDSSGTWPYLSGANFILISDFVYEHKLRNVEPVRQMQNGDVIFLHPDYYSTFFSFIYPKIKKQFILITHNSDHPTDERYRKHLNDEKLILEQKLKLK